MVSASLLHLYFLCVGIGMRAFCYMCGTWNGMHWVMLVGVWDSGLVSVNGKTFIISLTWTLWVNQQGHSSCPSSITKVPAYFKFWIITRYANKTRNCCHFSREDKKLYPFHSKITSFTLSLSVSLFFSVLSIPTY